MSGVTFAGWMFLAAPACALLFWLAQTIAESADRHGWQSVRKDALAFVILCACMAFGFYLVFGNG